MFPLICFAKGQHDAIDFVAIAIPSLRSLRLSHIRGSTLIMPLVAWRFLSGCQRLAYSSLVLGTPFLAAAAARVPFLNMQVLSHTTPAHRKCVKTAIFRCIMRKAPYRPTEAYLSYVRVEYKGLDKIRRKIAQFYLVPNNLSPASPNPGRM